MYASVNCWKLEFVRVTQNSGRAGRDSCLFNLCCEALQHKTPVGSLDYRQHNSHVCVVDTDGQADTVPSLCVWHPSTPTTI